jgi:hypothetical protein
MEESRKNNEIKKQTSSSISSKKHQIALDLVSQCHLAVTSFSYEEKLALNDRLQRVCVCVCVCARARARASSSFLLGI